MGFEIVKNLTLDVLKFVLNEPRHVKITAPIHLGKEQKPDAEGKKREPAWVASCINLEDGTECQIIVSAVVRSTLNDDYPNDSYVGKCFQIMKKARVDGKQYFPYGVALIEDPANAAPVAEEAAATPAAESAPVADIKTPARAGRR